MNQYACSNLGAYLDNEDDEDEKEDILHPSFEDFFEQVKQEGGVILYVDHQTPDILPNIWSFDCNIIETHHAPNSELYYRLYISVHEHCGGIHNMGSGEFKYYPDRDLGQKFEGNLQDTNDHSFELEMSMILPHVFRRYPI